MKEDKNREWKLVEKRENIKMHKKMLVAQANNSKAGSLDVPGNFQKMAFQMHRGYAANNLFIHIYLHANTAYDQFWECQT